MRTLGLLYPEHIDKINGLGELLAEALEARRHVEGCRGLPEFEFRPQNWGSTDLDTYPPKLWAARCCR